MSSDLEIFTRAKLWATNLTRNQSQLQPLLKFIVLVPTLKTAIDLIKLQEEDEDSEFLTIFKIARNTRSTEKDIMDSIISAIFMQSLKHNIMLTEIGDEDLQRLYKTLRWLLDLVIHP
jgi:hypothetical protein